MSKKEEICSYVKDVYKALETLSVEEIDRAINVLLGAYRKGKNIYIFGNGGSAATASHFVCDFNKGTLPRMGEGKRFKFFCLNDNIPMLTAISNDIGYDQVFRFQLESNLNKGDVIIAISGSGNSKNVIAAVEYAKSRGNIVIGLTGFGGGELMKLADINLNVSIEDMQITEDVHMILDHLMMKIVAAQILKETE